MFGGTEARSSAHLIEVALKCGIRHFDTAPSYSHGQSEEILGSALAGVPDVTIATKVGVIAPPGGPRRWSTLYRRIARPVLARTPRLKSLLLRGLSSEAETQADQIRRRLMKDEILTSLEQSLKRLKRDSVDLLLIHEPDGIIIDEAVHGEFLELQRQRRVKAFGLAWGRAVFDVPPFGQIVQSRYVDEVRPASGVGTKSALAVPTRLFHGVLRYSGARQRRSNGEGPGHRIRHVLENLPDAGVVFSASAAAQIADIARICLQDRATTEV
jgi:hypothetical protein